MSISDKSRKLLWSRAHNACAICHKALTVGADSADLPGLVLGEEAHIIARRSDGPRGRAGDRSTVDEYENLILLCAADHKRVDEQPDVFTVDRLRSLKSAHEAWAADRFKGAPDVEPIRIVKAPHEDSIPMQPITSGRQLWELLEGTAMRYIRSVEGPASSEASHAADALLDAANDWADVSQEVVDQGFSAVREAQATLDQLLTEVLENGLVVVGRRVTRSVKGGLGQPAPWPVVHIVVLTQNELEHLN